MDMEETWAWLKSLYDYLSNSVVKVYPQELEALDEAIELLEKGR